MSEAASVGINVARYPITPDCIEVSLPLDYADSLASTGCLVLNDFLTTEATAEMAMEARAEAANAWVTDNEHTAWQSPSDDSFSQSHVRNQMMRTRVASIPFDRIGPALRALYLSDSLLALIEVALGRPRGSLHRLADPLGACSINVFRTGAHAAGSTAVTMTFSAPRFPLTPSSSLRFQNPSRLSSPSCGSPLPPPPHSTNPNSTPDARLMRRLEPRLAF
jgi:hypothetical protein